MDGQQLYPSSEDRWADQIQVIGFREVGRAEPGRGTSAGVTMRRRWKEPGIHSPTKERPYYWFRITDSFGKKPVCRFSSRDEAKRKLAALHNQLVNSSAQDKALQRIEVEAAIDFFLRTKKDLRSVDRYYNYKRNFLKFINEKGIKLIDEINSERIREYMLWRQDNGVAKRRRDGGKQNHK
jgi:hypothetical protein